MFDIDREYVCKVPPTQGVIQLPTFSSLEKSPLPDVSVNGNFERIPFLLKVVPQELRNDFHESPRSCEILRRDLSRRKSSPRGSYLLSTQSPSEPCIASHLLDNTVHPTNISNGDRRAFLRKTKSLSARQLRKCRRKSLFAFLDEPAKDDSTA